MFSVGKKKLWRFLSASLLLVITVLMLSQNAPAKKGASLWGELSLEEVSKAPRKKRRSNYHTLRDPEGEQNKGTLRYKERKAVENPFFSFYKAQQKAEKPKKLAKPPKASLKKAPKQEQEQWLFGGDFSRETKEKYFEAVFRERQQIQDGKPLRIFLKDPIPALSLEEGTILKGVPSLQGNRIIIRITAAVVGDKVRRVSLHCFDKEDFQEGLYHDQLAERIEENTKEGLLDEVLDIDFKPAESLVKTGKITRKFSEIFKGKEPIFIERGKEVFVALKETTQ